MSASEATNDERSGSIADDAATVPGVQPAGVRISRRRLILVDALIAVTTVLAIVGMFSIYAPLCQRPPGERSRARG